ncbi:transposase [Prevotella nigrescens]|uniref:transposase n=2 Tax=Prevotella nigrescens TaxID=28133 RepID=UPI000E08A228|nr:transposase [Prevotella nigrescens]UAK28580.1 transposase [Prevotella nigrescens]WMS22315.1 transposase [Prevotella nigrescens]SUB93265.1 Transposase DDE domain [Prevotella nigrescens]
MLITNLISRYMRLCKAAFSAEDGAKLNESIQTNAMEMLFLLMVIPRRCNFTQMGRYGKRVEQCYRQTAERSVNWLEMNMWLSAFTFREGKGRNAIVIDPSFIKKAGKHTPYVGAFWSGCAGAVKHGLEILGIGVIDVDLHECMMLKAVQTTLEKGGEKKEMSLYDWYAKVLEDDKVRLQRICKVLVADSAFSKRPFIDKVMKMGFHVVSRLRHDAALFYTWDGEPTGKPGRPRVKGDKIDVRNIDMSKVEMLELEETSGKAYALKAWCKSLHRVVSLVIHELPNGARRLYFATDENMSGRDVVEYYTTRFQEEFCFRDAKQFLGLTDCQARDKRKLDFAFNSSFTALNVAKIMCKELGTSIGRLKAKMINAYYAQRIIDVFEKNPNTTLNKESINETFSFDADAA